MIKKLDKLIIKSFLGPFIITFFIAVFVLMMQILWKYIDDLIGKGLDLITIGQFLWYASASLLTLAMPIAILISSIMTFGNLGESFELVAIKSAGISLLRFMRPLMWIAILLCSITFLFANYVIPYSQLKFATLYHDIFYKKPAFDLKEGVFFTHIPGYAIKVGKKDPDGKTIRNVLIYENPYTNPVQNNSIIAESGVMKISDDKKFLEFNLKNGYRYEERGNVYDTATDFIRVGFKEFKKLFDLSILQQQSTPDSVFKNDLKMLSARQLNKSIDSLDRLTDTLLKNMTVILNGNLHFTNVSDSIWKATPAAKPSAKLVPDSAERLVKDKALGVAEMMKSTIQYSGTEISARQKNIRSGRIEWHRKFSLSLACLILFFIGAPLGSIIRKGGLGMPLIVAIIFFLIFHLLNMFGEKFVKEGLLSPAIGMWLAIIVLAPIGVFLTYKAMHDSQLFNKELYNRAFKRVKGFFTKKKASASSI
ncbi:LptF/LptG family permease [Ferruginibacter sp. HRS2-29]|uniref:LptF/LptG family permease n=1 Tax=Ferruginibacter sp. HRS2-29 TaxID=2487334 RepID=UPI0020CD3D66|nr:LptF/LptG family permease [Ferruginibacter sp. HRS2-29]MCP9750654.1 YjgP/YjgQ family permease [Ferruginibacter sp. HRS2-29]